MDQPLTLSEAKSKFRSALAPPVVKKQPLGRLWSDLAMAFLLGIAAGAEPTKNRNLSDTVLGAMQLGLGGIHPDLLRRVRSSETDIDPVP